MACGLRGAGRGGRGLPSLGVRRRGLGVARGQVVGAAPTARGQAAGTAPAARVAVSHGLRHRQGRARPSQHNSGAQSTILAKHL